MVRHRERGYRESRVTAGPREYKVKLVLLGYLQYPRSWIQDNVCSMDTKAQCFMHILAMLNLATCIKAKETNSESKDLFIYSH